MVGVDAVQSMLQTGLIDAIVVGLAPLKANNDVGMQSRYCGSPGTKATMKMNRKATVHVCDCVTEL